MDEKEVYRAIGLMSGTSLDGVDATLIETDGHSLARSLGFLAVSYPDDLRSLLRSCLGKSPDIRNVREAEVQMTEFHAQAVHELLRQTSMRAKEIDIIGFHGQTILHNPNRGITHQIGDGQRLARMTGIDVVHDFRRRDVESGGQGAPFLPLYHQAKVRMFEKPLVILNIGGVANITWLGTQQDDVLAFDTGPGNALMDDFIAARTEQKYDKDGEMAQTGRVDEGIVRAFLSDPYFALSAPKSLDRDQWSADLVLDLKTSDGLATLCDMSVQSIVRGIQLCPQNPEKILVAGGGRHNGFMMQKLSVALDCPVQPVEVVEWNGDALEAEGFAYLAVRSLLGEPLSLPSTTGVKSPQTGGVYARAA